MKAKQDRETVRRALESALLRLNGEIGRDEESTSLVVSETAGPASPLIVMFVGDVDPNAQDQPRVDTGRLATAKTSASAYIERQATHPGLERFQLTTTDPHPPAIKPCFMEPGRACCNSGACEMRGF